MAVKAAVVTLLILLGRIDYYSSLAAPAAVVLAVRESPQGGPSTMRASSSSSTTTTTTSVHVLQDVPVSTPALGSSSIINASTPPPPPPLTNPLVQPTRMIITVTKEVPTTVTVSVSASATTTPVAVTITETQIPTTAHLLPPPSSPPSSSSSMRKAVETQGLGPAKTIWIEPANLADLSPFRVSKFAAGEDNLEIVTSDEAAASLSGVSASSVVYDIDDGGGSGDPPPPSLIQIFYPAGSVNPGQKPLGGAEFYASPIEISDARNVTLRYSVFFPPDFDWVLAGKLPGLYGGHTGCSGGNAAIDCFSTRLMWRDGGAGELYLYAPKNKQTKNLCSSPGSFCDAAYGLSIGRGSFHWRAGDWTTIQQTVFLNTPGQQDGVFTLEVDGKRVISRKDILYRDVLMESTRVASGKGRTRKTKTKTKATTIRHAKSKTTTTTTTRKAAVARPKSTGAGSDGGLLGLGPVLGGLVGGLRVTVAPDGDNANLVGEALRQEVLETRVKKRASKEISSKTAASTEIKFAGIFFSTFFGGHDDKYETPRDQYIWFKDFALSYNS